MLTLKMECWNIGMLEYWVIKTESFFFYRNRNFTVLIGWLNCFNPIIPKFQNSIIPQGYSPHCL